MKLQIASILAATAVIASSASAQHSLLFAMNDDFVTLDGGSGLLQAGLLMEEEVGVVLPLPGVAYSAHTFIGAATQWAWRGDDDGDGRLVDSSTDTPGGDTDALMIKRFINAATGEVDPREVCFSKEGNYNATFQSWEDGDVYYHPTQGSVALFISEADIASACGIAVAFDLNAICQDVNGDLYMSFPETSLTVNGVAVEDGGIVRIPASGLTYDPISGDVTSVTPGTAEVIALEADTTAMVTTSGVSDYNGGGTSTSSFDISAIDIDPNGGTWTSPQTGGSYPNLVFGWASTSNEGALVSTAGGGTIATINGVMMGSAFQTTGTHLGLLPESLGLDGIAALVIAPAQATYLPLENYPINLVTTSSTLFTRQEVTNATPGGPVAFLFSVGPFPPSTGGVLTSVTSPIPGLFFGEFFEPGNAFVVTTKLANPLGYASNALVLPESARGSGFNICWQAFDFGRVQFSLPAPVQFL